MGRPRYLVRLAGGWLNSIVVLPPRGGGIIYGRGGANPPAGMVPRPLCLIDTLALVFAPAFSRSGVLLRRACVAKAGDVLLPPAWLIKNV